MVKNQATLDRWTHPFRVAPYLAVFWLVKFRFLFEAPRIWYRNSLRLGNISFGISDIDFTFFYPEPPPRHAVARLARHYRWLKKYLPILGEFNLFSQADLRLFQPYANAIELSRDPILLRELGASIPPPSGFAKVAFLLRMIESDARNLALRFGTRRRKWGVHFRQCELTTDERRLASLDSLLETLSRELFEPLSISRTKGFLEEFIIRGRLDYQAAFAKRKNRRQLLCLFPNRWLGLAVRHECFESDLKLVGELTEAEGSIFLEQLSWEIWGLSSQYRVLPKDETFPNHIRYLATAAQAIKRGSLADKVERIRIGFQWLGERYQEWHC